VLTIILQHVPLQQRLGVCTRVCHAFRTAAIAATNSISITQISSQARYDNAVKWLQLHGAGVTCLDIQHGGGFSLACWPCPALRDLNLQEVSVQPGFFSACTNLTRLLLTGCWLQSSPHATSNAAGRSRLTQLSVLCSLQHLELDNVRCPLSNSCCEFPGSLLSQLVQLTCLKLRYDQVQSDAALQHLSALSALQHLELNLGGLSSQQPAAAALTFLQQLPQLTALHLELNLWHGRMQQQPTGAALNGLQQLPQLTALKLSRVPWAIKLRSMPAITVLTALRVLHLEDCASVDPTVLATISLQQLYLSCRDPWDADGSAALLAAIGHLHELVKLELCHNRCWSNPSAAAYSALTASSHLQHLILSGCELPTGAWQQMFPPTRCLPELRHLYLCTALAPSPAVEPGRHAVHGCLLPQP